MSTFQTLIVSTATRVGMGNLVGVVAAISAGGAGAVFWMWVTALIGSSTAFIEATLAQLYKEKDPLYGGYRGGPAYYMHRYMERRQKKKKRYSLIAVLFAISGLICWCGIFRKCILCSAPLYNHRACSTCGSDRIAEERNCESTGSFSTGYGGMLFRSDDRDHFQEYRKPSSGF